MQELERIQTSRISYFADWWNIFDWIVYIWISVGVAVRIPALCGNIRASDVHREILALSMIVIWIRLLKAMRAFQALGQCSFYNWFSIQKKTRNYLRKLLHFYYFISDTESYLSTPTSLLF